MNNSIRGTLFFDERGLRVVTLKEARAARLLTMRELAEQAGVAPSTVYLIEHGRTVPQFSVIRRLADALEVKPAEIEEFAAAIEERGKEAA